jgi:L-2-hydroxyglutarate oxidase LhgO
MAFAAGKVDVIVCGAGAIGLSIARAAAMRGLEVLVLEQAARSGTGTTSRNSGVIHQGLYYPQASLKNKFCLEGKHMLSEYLFDRAIPHKTCGKLVVATDRKELDILKKMLIHAGNNGVNELKELTAGDVKAMEPGVSCVGALWSPKTSVFDVPAYISSLESDCELAGVTFVFNCTLQSANRYDSNEKFKVITDQGQIICKSLVNCAGLTAPMVAARVANYPKQLVPKMYFAKGNYFKLEVRYIQNIIV